MTRTEKDSLGLIEVPAERLWGASTERSRRNFEISTEMMPRELVEALALVKRAAAAANRALGLLDAEKATAIVAAAKEVTAGALQAEFPLVVWQTGSGTQTHLNMNEVLANRASELMGGERGLERLVHASDDVNLGQSSNDVIPTAMHVAAVKAMKERVIPAVDGLRRALADKASELDDVVKIGRTHLQDATPITLGQELSGYASQLEHGVRHLEAALPHLSELAIGGTAVGTGLNAHPELGERVANLLSDWTGHGFTSAPNKFEALAAKDGLVHAHGALKTVACSLMKIGNDIRLLASGPRSGFGEIRIPANEPGSSIMPGKVNPTQAEALTMVCAQVMGNDVTISVAGASGQLELNVFMPVIVYDFLQSCRLLADASASFSEKLIAGIEPSSERIRDNVERSLMLVTALNPHIGYDRSAEIAKKAFDENTTLKQAAVATGYVTAEEFDRWVRPEQMVGPSSD